MIATAFSFPGGFGDRGIEGKIEAVRYAREHKKPYLGLCLGMHMATIEFARHVAGLTDANSSEFHEGEQNVIDLMPDQKDVDMGGTMRLGLYPCKLEAGTISREVYGDELIYERHRHRYEFNNVFRKQLTESGPVIAGQSPDGKLVEIVELPREAFTPGSWLYSSTPNSSHVPTDRTPYSRTL